MMDRRRVLKGLMAGSTGLSLPLAGYGQEKGDDRAIVIGYPADVTNWDPISIGSAWTVPIFRCVFDKPLTIAPDLSFGPSVATGYRWLDKDGKTLEFKIRKGVTFHNGDPLTADDLRFTYNDRLKAEPTLSLASSWNLLDRVEVPAADTAVFHFKSPFVAAPQLIADATSYILPRRYFESVGREGFMQKPIGSGPYRLVEYERNARIVLEAYPHYWAGPAKVKKVTFRIIKDPSTRAAAIQAGQIDFANMLSVRDTVRLGRMPDLVADQSPVTSIMLIHMVNKGIYADQHLRLAMHHAIDKSALSKAFFNGKAAPLSTWSGEGMPAHDPGFNFAFDPEKSRGLLAKAGYSEAKPAEVELLTLSGVSTNDFDLARAIAEMWKRVGMRVKVTVLEGAHYAEASRSGKIEAPVLINWFNSTGDPYIYSGVILDPKKRLSIWKSDDIPPRLEPLFREVDYDRRIAGYRAFDRWAVEQGYALPLLQSASTVVYKKRLKYQPYKNGWPAPYSWSMS